MYTIIVEVFNQFNEVEARETFSSKTFRGASIKAGKWVSDGWGNAREDLTITKRKSTASDTMYFWEIR